MPTAIEWTEETWNPVTGCTKVSPGCDNCYAERITERFRGKGSFEKIVLHPERLETPLRWRKPRTVFVNSMSDLFHAEVPRGFVDQVWDVMLRTPQHTYQILTKRPGRMRALLRDRGEERIDLVLPNVWLGVSVEDQEQAKKRIPVLASTPAAVRFLSVEPMLGPVSPRSVAAGWQHWIRWVICGGESGLSARPIDPAWVRHLRDECTRYGVPFFFKQWGGRTPKANGRELDGRTWDEMPVPVGFTSADEEGR